MKYSPYEFKSEDAYDFANFVGIKPYRSGDELHFKKCPYCKNTTNDKKTFAINLRTGQFKCLRDSCGVTGNMITLSKDFDFSLGNEVDEYYKPKRQFKALPTPKEPIKPKAPAIKFLESRGISEEIANRYEITVRKDRDNILVFPFFDDKGRIQFIKYRKIDFKKGVDSSKEWCEEGCKPILFGMKQCVDFGTLIVTEGQMDSLAVAMAGYKNVVSVPNGSKGMSWFPYCWDWINKFEEIIVFGDFEGKHITLLEDFNKRLKKTIKHVREQDYRDCKDANDILLKYGSNAITEAIENAVVVPIREVVELADVQDVNIFEIEKLKTGFFQLDKLLYGGIPYGGVVILSGKPGEGKSTLASQFLLQAIEQNHVCFAYSGELPNYQFKAWMDFQCAGDNHIFEYQMNNWGDVGYKVSDSNKKTIASWYRGKIFLYDNSKLDSEESNSLLKIVENVIVQYGVDTILLDNLMTAIDLEMEQGSDKYERQSQFIKKLSRIALRYNALILLVAHKRKNNQTANENDEVSGSGDITNLATLTISYEKGKDADASERILKVSKNRLFGRTNTNGWVLGYSPKSKRIYMDESELRNDFSWCKDEDGFSSMEEMELSFE